MARKLHIIFKPQEYDYTCGPAALQMVLQYWGVAVSQARLTRLCRTTAAYGTPRRYLAEVARYFDFYAHTHSNTTLKEVEQLLQNRIPVIVNYRETHDEESHFAVIIQITSANVILHDPYHGPNTSLPKKEFLRRWHGKHITRHRRWMLAIAPKKSALPAVHK